MKKILTILLCLLLCGCKAEKHVDLDAINNFNYDDVQELDFDIHSKEYLLVRASDFKVLYSKDADKKIYPASLTKLMTLDTVLNSATNLDETSYVTYEQVMDLIEQDASLAGLWTDYDYTLRDLLYALILPSGADGAVALENYFSARGMNILDEMAKQLEKLGCNDTHFVNTTGLHDDNHYTTLNDLLKIVMDILTFEEGRVILESMYYDNDINLLLGSSLRRIYSAHADVLGGKTGFTDESGQSVIVLFKENNRSYILMVANAMGDPYSDQFWHCDDAMEIIESLC